jgi:hypothetical protein
VGTPATPRRRRAPCRSQRPPRTAARKVSGWPKRCRLVHAFLREYGYKRLELAQLLCQLGVFLTCSSPQCSGSCMLIRPCAARPGEQASGRSKGMRCAAVRSCEGSINAWSGLGSAALCDAVGRQHDTIWPRMARYGPMPCTIPQTARGPAGTRPSCPRRAARGP